MTNFSKVGKEMRLIFIIISLTSFLLSACVPYDFSRRVVQQGNLLPAKRVNRIKVGMSKQQVAVILGSSLLTPTFSQNRWDYAYTWRKGSGTMIVKNATVYFSGDRVSRIEHHP